jgi:hypothetical protein
VGYQPERPLGPRFGTPSPLHSRFTAKHRSVEDLKPRPPLAPSPLLGEGWSIATFTVVRGQSSPSSYQSHALRAVNFTREEITNDHETRFKPSPRWRVAVKRLCGGEDGRNPGSGTCSGSYPTQRYHGSKGHFFGPAKKSDLSDGSRSKRPLRKRHPGDSAATNAQTDWMTSFAVVKRLLLSQGSRRRARSALMLAPGSRPKKHHRAPLTPSRPPEGRGSSRIKPSPSTDEGSAPSHEPTY